MHREVGTMNGRVVPVVFASLILSTLLLPILSVPNLEEGRKFISKPNDMKKMNYNNLKESSSGSSNNLINSNPNNGFSWMNIFAMGLQILLQALQPNSLERSDSLASQNKVLSSLFSGAFGKENMYDVNVLHKQAIELVNLIISLLDTLKTTFTKRSIQARSNGLRDPIADGSIAFVSIMKGYAKSLTSSDETCIQKHMCNANRECANDSHDTGYIFCQLGSYGTSWILGKRTSIPIESFMTASRKGRALEDCEQIYEQCNEV